MADRKPLKVLPDGGGDSTGLGEFVAADTVGVVDGGTGLATVGSNQLLTGNGTSALTSESNLTFDGTTLNVVGNAGVGIARTDGTLHVHTASAGSVVANVNEDDLVVENNTHGGIHVLVPDASDGSLVFGSPTDAVGAIVRWNHDNSLFRIGTANAGSALAFETAASVEAMRINSSGNVGIGTASPSAKLDVTIATNSMGLDVYNSDTNFSQQHVRLPCDRAASSSYDFIKCYSGTGYGDTEFLLRGDGNGYADGSWSGSGADYQEFFESSDGSALEVGKSVVMDGDKVRVYNASSDSTDNIIGVVRPKADNKNSAVIGNTAWNHWTDKYLTDDWGVYLREDVTVWEWDEVRYAEGDDIPEDKQIGDVKIEAGSCYERDELAKDPAWTAPTGATSSTQSVRKRNPDYDESQGYAPREERDEWNLIGLLGQVQIKANEPTRPTWIKMKQISDSVDLWLVR